MKYGVDGMVTVFATESALCSMSKVYVVGKDEKVGA